MVITAITLENFKGIKGPCRIKLRPLTMLFGANSAGKSSVIQALHYAREIFVNNNFNPDKVEIGGEIVDLGGFSAMVRDHNLEHTISIKLEIDLLGEELPVLGGDIIATTLEESVNSQELWTNSEGKLSEVRTAWVKVDLAWNSKEKSPFVQRYHVGINDADLATIHTSAPVVPPTVECFNPVHPLFKSEEYEQERAEIIAEAEADDKSSPIISLDFVALGAAFLFPQLRPALRMYAGARMAYEGVKALSADSPEQTIEKEALESEYRDYAELNSSNANITLAQSIGKGALPNWSQLLPLNIPSEDEEELTSTHMLLNKTFLSTLIVGPGAVIADQLKRMCYVGPIREVPERNNVEVKSSNPSRWANGLAAWDALYSQGDELIKKTNHWLASDERLDSGYRIGVEEFRRINENGRLMAAIKLGRSLDDYPEELEDILRQSPEKRLYLVEETKNIEVLPQDIGVGISQVVPVVVGSLLASNCIVAIEQPELHIHPKLQVGLGDLFIQESTSKSNCFIIETHSEHLMLRIMKRIRQTSGNELPPHAPPLNPDQVAIYHIRSAEDGTIFKEIVIDKDGDFLTRWPGGFFAERSEELFS